MKRRVGIVQLRLELVLIQWSTARVAWAVPKVPSDKPKDDTARHEER